METAVSVAGAGHLTKQQAAQLWRQSARRTLKPHEDRCALAPKTHHAATCHQGDLVRAEACAERRRSRISDGERHN